jgi:aerobic carbon-monoxide dehydrogenase medium subunit
MYAAEFDYYKADSVGDAIRMLRSHDGAKLLAGGHSLLPLMKLRLARPAAVIDIGGIRDLKGVTRHDNTLRIGALTTHWEIASSEEVKNHCPLLAEVAAGIGDPQVRNRGTIGGNVAHADPASDWPTALTALDARFVLQVPGPLGGRTISAEDFFKGAFTTALEDDHVLTAIEVPCFGLNQKGEYAKMAHPASYYAVVGGAVVVTIENHQCTAARVAVGGLVPSPVRATSVENALVGKELTRDNIAQAADHLADDLGDDVFGDIYASAEFRRSVAPVEIRHALYHAIGTAHH